MSEVGYELYLFRGNPVGLVLPDDLERPQQFESLDRATIRGLILGTKLAMTRDEPRWNLAGEELVWEGRTLVAQLWLGEDNDGPLRLPALSIVQRESDDDGLFEREALSVMATVLEVAASIGAHIYDPQQEIVMRVARDVLTEI